MQLRRTTCGSASKPDVHMTLRSSVQWLGPLGRGLQKHFPTTQSRKQFGTCILFIVWIILFKHYTYLPLLLKTGMCLAIIVYVWITSELRTFFNNYNKVFSYCLTPCQFLIAIIELHIILLNWTPLVLYPRLLLTQFFNRVRTPKK